MRHVTQHKTSIPLDATPTQRAINACIGSYLPRVQSKPVGQALTPPLIKPADIAAPLSSNQQCFPTVPISAPNMGTFYLLFTRGFGHGRQGGAVPLTNTPDLHSPDLIDDLHNPEGGRS